MSPDNEKSYSEREQRVDNLRVSLFWVFVVALVISLALAAEGWGESFDPHARHWPWIKIAQAVMLALWIFLPPVVLD